MRETFVASPMRKYSETQPRGENGRWTSIEGGLYETFKPHKEHMEHGARKEVIARAHIGDRIKITHSHHPDMKGRVIDKGDNHLLVRHEGGPVHMFHAEHGPWDATSASIRHQHETTTPMYRPDHGPRRARHEADRVVNKQPREHAPATTRKDAAGADDFHRKLKQDLDTLSQRNPIDARRFGDPTDDPQNDDNAGVLTPPRKDPARVYKASDTLDTEGTMDDNAAGTGLTLNGNGPAESQQWDFSKDEMRGKFPTLSSANQFDLEKDGSRHTHTRNEGGATFAHYHDNGASSHDHAGSRDDGESANKSMQGPLTRGELANEIAAISKGAVVEVEYTPSASVGVGRGTLVKATVLAKVSDMHGNEALVLQPTGSMQKQTIDPLRNAGMIASINVVGTSDTSARAPNILP